jgi:sulfoxide reductase catalytic subunit YedY
MLIRSPRKSDPASSEITPEHVYLNRRRFMKRAAGAAALLAASPGALAACADEDGPGSSSRGVAFGGDQEDELTPYEDVTSYNNFYEFGTDKRDPARYADEFDPEPWTVEVDGLCNRPGTYDLWDLLKRDEVEERIYRLRCVEAWSMVIPWEGVPLRNVISRVEPMADAKYVAFETVVRPEEMRGQRRAILDWPYVEGLRIDEASNELALLVTGLYGRSLPNQNGAPIRLMVPWKYGFKSIKSVVRISFVEAMPPTTWNRFAPQEYGFYANVNPNVDHPRWSQARERRIGELRRRETLMFNGYEEEVGHLYRGMDLATWY